MKKRLLHKQRGLSLVELMLVTAVIGIIVVGGIRNVDGAKMEADTLQLERSLNTALSAMRAYWFINCASSASVNLSHPYTVLSDNKILPTGTNIFNPFSDNRTNINVKYYTSNKVAFVQAYAQLSLLSTTTGADVARRLKGTYNSSNKNIYLTRAIGMDGANSSLWILRNDLERFRRFENVGSNCLQAS